jgi:hypothetical protein
VHWAPGIPHALFWGGRFINASGAIRAAGMRSRTQHCAVIASEAKQSSFLSCRPMDCFASLAMTI